MPMKKICILTTSFPLNEDSASGIFVKQLADSLAEKASIEILTPDTTGHTFNFTKKYNVAYFRYAPKKLQTLSHRPGGIPAALHANKLAYLLLPAFLLSMFSHCVKAGIKNDIIQANWSINGLIASIAGRITGTATITTLRGEDINRAKTSYIDKIILRLTLRLSDKIVTVSSEMHQALLNSYPIYKRKMAFIPNGVCDQLLRLPIKKDKHQHRKLNIICIGSLIPRKCIDQILQAISLFSISDRPNLQIVGDGPLKAFLEKTCNELGIKRNVIFTGAVPHHKIKDHIFENDILILSSESEGRPNVVVEAMAAGKVVIASNISGTRELISDQKNGFLYNHGDSDHLFEKISTLNKNRLMIPIIGQAARDRIISEKLDWNNTANKYLTLFEKACN